MAATDCTQRQERALHRAGTSTPAATNLPPTPPRPPPPPPQPPSAPPQSPRRLASTSRASAARRRAPSPPCTSQPPCAAGVLALLARRRVAPVGVRVERGPRSRADTHHPEHVAHRRDLPGQRSRTWDASRCAAGLLLRRRRGSRDTDGVVLEPQALQAVPVAGALLFQGVHEDEHAAGVRVAACQCVASLLADWRRQVKQGEDSRELGARGVVADVSRGCHGWLRCEPQAQRVELDDLPEVEVGREALLLPRETRAPRTSPASSRPRRRPPAPGRGGPPPSLRGWSKRNLR